MGYTVIKLVEGLTATRSRRHIMHINAYLLILLFVLAVVGAGYLVSRIHDDINTNYHFHCKKIYQLGHEAGKNGRDKWEYHPADLI